MLHTRRIPIIRIFKKSDLLPSDFCWNYVSLIPFVHINAFSVWYGVYPARVFIMEIVPIKACIHCFQETWWRCLRDNSLKIDLTSGGPFSWVTKLYSSEDMPKGHAYSRSSFSHLHFNLGIWSPSGTRSCFSLVIATMLPLPLPKSRDNFKK